MVVEKQKKVAFCHLIISILSNVVYRYYLVRFSIRKESYPSIMPCMAVLLIQNYCLE
jgi:hypothetical protein